MSELDFKWDEPRIRAERKRRSPLWPTLGIVASLFVVPLLLCGAHRLLPLGSIGPAVITKFLIDLGLMPFLAYQLGVALTQRSPRLLPPVQLESGLGAAVFLAASVLLGLVLAAIGVNFFIGLTQLTGLMDYQLM